MKVAVKNMELELDGLDLKIYNQGFLDGMQTLISGIMENKHHYSYMCSDVGLEYCTGSDCEECENKLKQELEEIANNIQLKNNI